MGSGAARPLGDDVRGDHDLPHFAALSEPRPGGGVLLSVAALRTGTLGILRCVLLLAWAWTFLGVLKESDVGSIQGGIALCVVMVPVGIELLRRRLTGLEEPSVPDDRRRELTEWLW